MSETAAFPGSPEPVTKAPRDENTALRLWEASVSRKTHDARVRSAKSVYAPIFTANGRSPSSARRPPSAAASPFGAPVTPTLGSYASMEMTRRALHTPPSDFRTRAVYTPGTTPKEKHRQASHSALLTTPLVDSTSSTTGDPKQQTPPASPMSKIRAAATKALTHVSVDHVHTPGVNDSPTEQERSSPLGPGSSLGGSRLARMGKQSRSPVSRLPSLPAECRPSPVTQADGLPVKQVDGLDKQVLGLDLDGAHHGEHSRDSSRVLVETPSLADACAPRSSESSPSASPALGSVGRPSTGRTIARFLKRRQQLRVERGGESGFTKLDAMNDKENRDPAWAEFGEAVVLMCAMSGKKLGTKTEASKRNDTARALLKQRAKHKKAGAKTKTKTPLRSPLATLYANDAVNDTFAKTQTTKSNGGAVHTESLASFIARATSEAEAYGACDFDFANDEQDLDVFDDSLANDEDKFVGQFMKRGTSSETTSERTSPVLSTQVSEFSELSPQRAGARNEVSKEESDDDRSHSHVSSSFGVSPPTAADTPSPLRSANSDTRTKAWLAEGYKEIRASAAVAARRYAEDDCFDELLTPEDSEAGYAGEENADVCLSTDAWDEYAGSDGYSGSNNSGNYGNSDPNTDSPFKMLSPKVLRAAAAETARSASLSQLRYS